MDLGRLGVLDCGPDGVDLVAVCLGEGGHSDLADLARDPPGGFLLACRLTWVAGLDHIDAKPLQLPGQPQLRGRVQVKARRLLTVAEGRVEDIDATRASAVVAVLSSAAVAFHLRYSLETRKPPPLGRGLCDLFGLV